MNKIKSLNSILIVWIITLLLTWFGNGTKTEGIVMSGFIIFMNPVTIICMISYFVGLYNKKYSQTLNMSIISWVMVIVMEIITLLTWFYFFDNDIFDITTALSYSRIGFYISLIVSILLLIRLIYMKKNNYRN